MLENDVIGAKEYSKLDASEISLSIDEEFWVFGYGSLVWKVDFPIEKQEKGYIKGYHRRFYQNSIDHRGTHEKPGRVVTLIPTDDEESIVHGIAYKIPDQQRREVIEHLDFREKNGYERRMVTFYPCNYENGVEDTQPTRSIVIYVATKDNESYAGHRNDLNDIANQIFEAHGPSGSNCEYVYRLADAMRLQFPHHHDDHLFELEKLLKEKERRSSSG